MGDDLGLRERKKRRTRLALAEAALRLFEERGYERVTVAEIAAAADVAPRTFFGYFASKEDVVFIGTAERVETLLHTIAGRRPEETAADVLERAIRRVVGELDGSLGLAPARLRLIMSVPSLQARALYLTAVAQRRLAEALQRSAPGELDFSDASVMVVLMTSAPLAALVTGLVREESARHIRAAVERAMDMAVHGLGSGGSGVG
ncbi:TetR/AcrR family transcriptional regulator [Streptomyces sp. UNOB3_S3]|uniref:TetR/AcrR family transcriptional regulator n=1 Tax=Streptomyces sp. UNOB3_S3 TaxID=2871682 RepID=UPI001E3F1907|nr:TetR family transcriptional regulator [Streptomyces sp. UNOB3_S3]MCC3775010.1 TetR family transcriptional regulator [Streptomyces sp. UNOB3_S3]